jgi:Lon protease-like protein
VRDGALDEIERSEQIELEHGADGSEVGPVRGLVKADTGVVDENIDPAIARESTINHGFACAFIEKVTSGDEGIAAGHAFQLLLRAGGQREACAATAEGRNASGTDAFGSASDNNNLVVYLHQEIAGSVSKRHNSNMQDPLLPLFPLQMVLLPRTPLPLHIFEDRYKEMFNELIQSKSEFGVVQAGDKGIVSTGCTATVEKVLAQYPDGRMDVLTLGRRRFEIVMLNDERSFLRGSVEFFDDEDTDPVEPEMQLKALKGFTELKALGEQHVFGEPRIGDPQLSFQLAQLVGDMNFRQILLGTRSEAERIRQLAEYLPVYTVRQKHVAHMKEVAPRNGHSKLPPSNL